MSRTLAFGLGVRAPYPGLRPFFREESLIFFGRQEQVDQMLVKLHNGRFLGVVGTSGCGKSSLVRAGLLPALDGGFLLNGGTRWLVADMQPRNQPFVQLAQALLSSGLFDTEWQSDPEAKAMVRAALRRGPRSILQLWREAQPKPDGSLLLLVDQFEEIFRFHEHQDRNGALAFVNLLLESARQTERPIYVVITMRSDFLGQCSLFADFPEALNQAQFLVPRLTREQRHEAIIGPARVFGGDVAPALVNRLLNDTGTAPDQLPLMQHVLMRMWTRVETRPAGAPQDTLASEMDEKWEGLILTLSDYEAPHIGGLTQALSIHANAAYAELNGAQQHIAERLFRCLSERSTEQRDTRRPVPLELVAQVAGVEPEEVMAVVEVFRRPDRSFLTPSVSTRLAPDTVLDISHESLIRHWQRLDQWAQQEVESAQYYRHLEQTAKHWARGEAALWVTPDLEKALEWREREKPAKAWAQRYGADFDLAMEFLDASQRSAKAQHRAEEEARQRELSHARAFAEVQQQRTEAERQRAEAERQRAEEQAKAAQYNRRWATAFGVMFLCALLAFLFALGLRQEAKKQEQEAKKQEQEAKKQEQEAKKQEQEAKKQEQEAKKREQEAVQLHRIFQWQSTLLSQTIVLSAPFTNLSHQQRVLSYLLARQLYIFINKDGVPESYKPRILENIKGSLYTFFRNSSNGGNKKSLLELDRAYLLDQIEESLQTFVGSSSNTGNGAPEPRSDKARLLDQIKEVLQTFVRSSSEPAVRSIAFSPDGKTLASGGSDLTIRLWDPHQSPLVLNAVLRGHKDTVRSIVFSHDGKMLFSGGNDRTLRLWDLRQASGTPQVLYDQENVTAVVFSHDGTTLAFGTENYITYRYVLPLSAGTPTSPALPEALCIHEDIVNTVAFSPDGLTLASGGNDGLIKLCDLRQAPTPSVLHGHEGPLYSLAFSPDGQTLASGGKDALIRLWDLRQSPIVPPAILRGHEGTVRSLVFSPDGKTLASGGDEPLIRLWDLRQSPIITTAALRTHEGAVYSLAFSPDGKTLASGGNNNSVLIWPMYDEELPDLVCEKVTRNLSLDEWEQYIGLDIPYERTCANVSLEEFIKGAKDRAIRGDIDMAIKLLRRAKELDNTRDSDPEEEIRNAVRDHFLKEVQSHARAHRINEALEAFKKAQNVILDQEISAEYWHHLCWHGSLARKAEEVIDACEKAVALVSKRHEQDLLPRYRDSRGLARALLKKNKEAIEDFEFYLQWIDEERKKGNLNPDPNTPNPEGRADWINRLRKDENPESIFTQEVLDRMKTIQ